MVWATMKRFCAAPSGRQGLGQQVGDLDPLRLDRLGGDAFADQEGGDRGAVGVDLGLDLVEIVAGRGGAQRPDREIGHDKSLGQALDGDVVLGCPALLEAMADQPAGPHQAQPDQGGGEQIPLRW
jgi:hypothetical protein